MTILTKSHRTALAQHLLTATFRERELRLKQEEHALGLRLLRETYGAEALRRMADLPEGWMPTTQTLRINGNVPPVMLSDPVRVPSRDLYNFNPGVGWLGEWEGHQGKRRAIKEERESLRREILGTLQAFRTVEKLAEGWPEGYAHFPHPELAPANLPALRIEDLNARLSAAREAA